MPEFWVLNAGLAEAARRVPVRSGLFLSAREDRSAWVENPIVGGVVRSSAVPGLEFDLAAFWADCES